MPEARTTRTVHRRLRRQHRLRKTFCREPFREDGVEYKLSEKPKSDLDAETLKNVLDTAIKREVLVRDCEAQGYGREAAQASFIVGGRPAPSRRPPRPGAASSPWTDRLVSSPRGSAAWRVAAASRNG